MFFLLAAFMLVSVTMHQNHCLPLNLQTAQTGQSDEEAKTISVSVDKEGQVYLDRTLTSFSELKSQLASRYQSNPEVRVYVAGDRETPHGKIIGVLDLIRSAGIQKIAFTVNPSRP